MTPTDLTRAALESALRDAQVETGREVVVMVGGTVLGSVPEGGLLVTVLPVTEAVKVVSGDRVVGSLDREDLAEPSLPLAIHASTLRRILNETNADPIDLPGEVARRGGRVVASH